jgi:hypothetical protein
MEDEDVKMENDSAGEKSSDESASILKMKASPNGDGDTAVPKAESGNGNDRKKRVIDRKTRGERRSMHDDNDSRDSAALKRLSSSGEIQVSASRISPVRRIVKIILGPGEAFDDIKIRPRPLVPFILCILIGAVSAYLSVDAYMAVAKSAIPAATTAALDESALAAMMKTMEIVLYPTIILGLVFTILVKSGVSHGLSVILGGEGKFSSTLGVIAYSYVIYAFGVLVSAILAKITGVYGSTLSLALFLPDSDRFSVIANLLKFADVFTVWYLGVSVYGMMKVHDYSGWKAAIAILVPFVALVAISTLAVALSPAPAGM